MNTDISDPLLKETMYRDAVNLRLLTNQDSNGYSLHTVDGTSDAITFVSPIDNSTVITVSGNIIDQTTIRKYNVVISVDTNNNWFVYKYDTTSNLGTDLNPKYVLT